jgi:3-dehydroquinate synthase
MAILQHYQLPTTIPQGITVPQLLEVMHRDKKVQAGQLRWALPRTIGQAEIVRNVPIATVQSVLSTLIAKG